MKTIKGDLIKLALQREFDVIAHGCNCQCRQKSGIAALMVKTFQTNNEEYYIGEREDQKGNINKLGTIDWAFHFLNTSYIVSGSFYHESPEHEIEDIKNFVRNEKGLIVVNAYTQFEPGINSLFPGEPPINYAAMELCFTKMNYLFAGLKIGLPLIGGGLAGGSKGRIISLMKTHFKNCDLTLVEYGN